MVKIKIKKSKSQNPTKIDNFSVSSMETKAVTLNTALTCSHWTVRKSALEVMSALKSWSLEVISAT